MRVRRASGTPRWKGNDRYGAVRPPENTNLLLYYKNTRNFTHNLLKAPARNKLHSYLHAKRNRLYADSTRLRSFLLARWRAWSAVSFSSSSVAARAGSFGYGDNHQVTGAGTVLFIDGVDFVLVQ
jgi:hypothetical protein